MSEDSPEAETKIFPYWDEHRKWLVRTWPFATAAIAATATLGVLALWLAFLQLSLIEIDVQAKQGIAPPIDRLDELANNARGLTTPIVLASAAVLVLLAAWMNRVYTNLPALGARELRGSPGGAAGWWFVPIVNLYVPFLYIREIWRATTPEIFSNNQKARSTIEVAPVILFWWGLRVLTFAMAVVSWLLPTRTLDDVIRWRAYGMSLRILDGVYCIAGIAVIYMVELRQRRRNHLLSSSRSVTTESALISPAGETARTDS